MQTKNIDLDRMCGQKMLAPEELLLTAIKNHFIPLQCRKDGQLQFQTVLINRMSINHNRTN